MENLRCPGCMQEKMQRPVCERCGYDERTPNAPHQLPVGSTLQERYQVGKVLGQGGFGITYIGYDRYLDTPVAIKEYYPSGVVIRDCTHSLSVTAIEGEYSNFYAENRQRFFREAKALARFADVPNIVHIQNLFMENNTAYIVMEYLQGVTLKDHIAKRGGRLTQKETFSLLLPIMKALKTVHDAGIVHRDLSPDNIMLLPDGKAKLLDFGAVREVHGADADKPLTQSTEAILKHGFAPIEQYQRRGGLGPWTDVYAMCATIYYCLTGRVPPDAPLRVMGEGEVDWNAVPGLTPQQRTTLTAGMTLAPKQRIPNMSALAFGLFGDAPTQPKKPSGEYPSGTVALGREEPPYTAPLSQNEVRTVPLSREEVRTAPLSREEVRTAPAAPYTAPVNYAAQTEAVSRPAPQPKRTLPKWLLPGAIAALAAVLGMVLLAPKQDEKTQTLAEPVPEATQTPPNGKAKPYEFDSLDYTMKVRSSHYGSEYAGMDIFGVYTLTFLDTTEDAPDNAVDVSYLDNGKVLAWFNESGSTLYIAADGGVYAPEDSSYLFEGWTEIEFNGAFHTDNVTNMSHMFDNCAVNSENWDLSFFNTENVTDMSNMFRGCVFLKGVSLSGWDTSNVENMSEMFYLCSNLKQLDVTHFDTSRVTDMSGMFAQCHSLQELDLSGFNTAQVTDISYMFETCLKLEKLDVSSFDTSSVKNFNFMFWNTKLLTNVTADFNVSSAETHTDFMDEGETFNNRPWEELFR